MYNMKLYLIEYYDTVSDRTEYDTIFGFSESHARDQFQRKTNNTKIIVSVEKNYKKVRLDHGRINHKTEKPDV